MKKIFHLLALLAWATASSLYAGDIRLAVLEFENNTGRQDVEHLKKGLRDFFVTDLQELSGVTLVERGRIDEVLKEIKMTRSKYFDPATAAKMGKQMGASHVLTGAYFCMNKKWRMDIRVVSTETGEVLVTGKQDGTEDDVFDMEKALVETMAKKLKPDLSRRELRKLNRPQTEKYASFDKYSRAVDKAESGDVQSAAELMQEISSEDKEFSLAADQLEKYKTQLLKDIEQHAKSSKERALSDQEYVEQDFQNALKRLQLRDDTPDYYVSILIGAFHYSLRDRRKNSGDIQKLLEKYEAEFLCKTHSPQVLQETSEKLDQRLLSLQDKICKCAGEGENKRIVGYKDHFKKFFSSDTVLLWPNDRPFGFYLWTPVVGNGKNKDLRSYVCAVYFIFNHHLLNDPPTLRDRMAYREQLEKKYYDEIRSRDKKISPIKAKSEAMQKAMKADMAMSNETTHRNVEAKRLINMAVRAVADSKDKNLKSKIYSTVNNPPHGVENWTDIVIKSLHDLEQYEKNKDRRAVIKQALVYAIDAKETKVRMQDGKKHGYPRQLLLKKLGEDQQQSSKNMAMGYLLIKKGNDKGLILLDHALAVRIKKLGEEPPDTAEAYHFSGLARLELAKRNNSDDTLPLAEEYLRNALAVRMKKLGPDHPRTKETIRALEQLKRIRSGKK